MLNICGNLSYVIIIVTDICQISGKRKFPWWNTLEATLLEYCNRNLISLRVTKYESCNKYVRLACAYNKTFFLDHIYSFHISSLLLVELLVIDLQTIKNLSRTEWLVWQYRTLQDRYLILLGNSHTSQ